MAKNAILSPYKLKRNKKRPGVHAKTKTSRMKHSKNYVKLYKGQGR